MQTVIKQIEALADTMAMILIRGERHRQRAGRSRPAR